MAASTWKGFITFGLISVPIRLFPAARYSHISFHEVHKKCGHRVQQQLYCPYDEEVVTRDELVMGYETEDDKMISWMRSIRFILSSLTLLFRKRLGAGLTLCCLILCGR
jgi:non-homologous end joining protein Ku